MALLAVTGVVRAQESVEALANSYMAALEKKDIGEMIKTGVAAHAAAKKAAAGEGQAADFGKQTALHIEDSMFRVAVEVNEKDRVALCEAILSMDPDKEYLTRAATVVFPTYSGAKAVALAEKVVAVDQTNPDMLLAVASSDLEKGRADRAGANAGKVIDVLDKSEKPEGMSADAWASRKANLIGVAHYVRGAAAVSSGRYAAGDKELRAALPSAGGSLKAQIFFQIGVANAKMNRAQDAVDNFKACAAMNTGLKAQAEKNIAAIKAAAPYVR